MSKVTLVIGGTGGLGRACAESAAAKGHTVIVSGRNQTKGNDVVQAIRSRQGVAEFVACDLSSDAEIKSLHSEVLEKHCRLDYAVNAAGVASSLTRFTDVTTEAFANTMRVNVTAVMVCMQEQIKIMEKQGKGSIVNFTSIFGLAGVPWGAPYSASKHALIGLTKSAALECGSKGVTVNAVAPGHVPTEMVEELVQSAQRNPELAGLEKVILGQYPTGRFGTPDEVAKSVLYLLESEWTTGITLEIDGGWGAGKNLAGSKSS